MMINEILKLKYPDADFMTNIILQDDGKGIWIKEWNLETPQPNQQDLDQWAIDLAPEYRKQQDALANAPIFAQLDEIDLKSIRALRAKDDVRLANLEAQAVALRAKLL